MINPEDYEPDADAIDAMTLGELAELSDRDHDVAKVLTEYKKEFGLMSSSHGVGTFLELLAAAGYRVEPIVVPDIDSLLPPSAD